MASSALRADALGGAALAAERVLVVGGGFAGLQAVRALAGTPAQITLIDRHNYHLFQPLSYQVATGALAPGEIALPLRRIFARQRNVRVLMGQVSDFDLNAREVQVQPVIRGTEPHRCAYDHLIVAGGSNYSYFGNDHWRPYALEVKSLDSALEVRGRILQAFEAAESEPDAARRERWLTFVVIGAGPTGVEMAGQIAELAHDTLPRELRAADSRSGSVLLVELAERPLPAFAPELSDRAARSLRSLGVTLALQKRLVDIDGDSVTLEDADAQRSLVPTRTVIWAAGVMASPLAGLLAEQSGESVDRAGRITVEPDLSLRGHPEVFALGDMVRVRPSPDAEGVPLPGLAPVAMQQGRHAASIIAGKLSEARNPTTGPRPGQAAAKDAQPTRPSPAFRYRDKGTLATIGRGRAVASLRGLKIWGLPAWLAWLTIHIFYLIGFENRLLVLLRWSYSFFTRGRGSRLITQAAGTSEPD